MSVLNWESKHLKFVSPQLLKWATFFVIIQILHILGKSANNLNGICCKFTADFCRMLKNVFLQKLRCFKK